MKRVVLDTNVLVSSVLGGALETIMVKWLSGKFTLIASDGIINEYLDVLNRSKLHLKRETIERITAYIVRHAEYVVPQEDIHFIESDPKDDKFLEAAIAGKAHIIVSGDKHLLDIEEFQGIEIITAREFITQYLA